MPILKLLLCDFLFASSDTISCQTRSNKKCYFMFVNNHFRGEENIAKYCGVFSFFMHILSAHNSSCIYYGPWKLMFGSFPLGHFFYLGDSSICCYQRGLIFLYSWIVERLYPVIVFFLYLYRGFLHVIWMKTLLLLSDRHIIWRIPSPVVFWRSF